MVKTVLTKTWHNCEHKLGQFMEDTDYDVLVTEDMDFYAPNKNTVNGSDDTCSEDNVIFKFRKGVFTPEEQIGAYEGLVGAATPSQNRGVAAGPKSGRLNNRDWVTDFQMDVMEFYIGRKNSLFDEENAVDAVIKKHENRADETTRGIVWLRNTIASNGYEYDTFFQTKMDEWASMSPDAAAVDAKNTKDTYVSATTYAMQVNSGIAGFFDRYPRIPYGRATSYTEHNREKYEKCYPYMRKLTAMFKELLPTRYNNQLKCAEQLDDCFRVANKETPFTTITVNKNFRTAAHRDAGDLSSGFSNLSVVAKDKEWEGGYLVLPEFRVAIDLRPGDVLLINNHEGIHGNTELRPPAGKPIEEMERISLVCYFREKMLELGDCAYEGLRHDFVEGRRLNKDHPLHQGRQLWNGVSEGMWTSGEWYEFLEDNGGRELVQQYHPEALKQASSLEDFFL